MVAVAVKQVAARVGLSSRSVRYYDRIGLARADEPSTSGHCLYGPEGEGRLRFIRRAKTPGFSLDEIRGLLKATEGGCAASMPELERLLDQKVAEIDVKIAEFVAFREPLAEYRAARRSHDEGCCGDGAFCTCLDDP